MDAKSLLVNGIETPEQRVAGVIGQIIVENAKLGYEVAMLRMAVATEKARADAAEQRAAAAERRAE